MSSHFLLQGIFSTQGSNSGLLHCRQILYHLSCQGSPKIIVYYKKKYRLKLRKNTEGKVQKYVASHHGVRIALLFPASMCNNTHSMSTRKECLYRFSTSERNESLGLYMQGPSFNGFQGVCQSSQKSCGHLILHFFPFKHFGKLIVCIYYYPPLHIATKLEHLPVVVYDA